MGANSTISWTDHTFNSWEGCTKVSPGCAHCYAEARNQRFAAGANWGPGAPRRRTVASTWAKPIAWNRKAYLFTQCHVCGWRGDAHESERATDHVMHCPSCDTRGSLRSDVRQRVFCASLADWLDDEVPIEWLADLMVLVRECDRLDWLLLTKRPQNWAKRIAQLSQFRKVGSPQFLWEAAWYLHGNPPANVWLGTTVEDQQRADERLPALLSIPARVRFLSCEPLLEAVDLDKWLFHPTAKTNISGIQWVICGGESGPGAREFNEEWARNLKSQCRIAGVPFFMKQMGSRPVLPSGVWSPYIDRMGGDISEWPVDLRVQEFPNPARG